jgi:hypothetical protein
MPSNKFTVRRRWPVAPHVCHKPPPPPITPPPPAGEYWILPAWQEQPQGAPASGTLYAQSDAYSPTQTFTIVWDLPSGWMAFGEQVGNGETIEWQWDSNWNLGAHTITAHIMAGAQELATLTTTVFFTDWV